MKLPCYLVRDLLPLYKDEVCGEATAADVKAHLQECPDCTAALNALAAAEGAGALQSEVAAALAPAQAAAAASLKQVKRRLLLQKLAAALIACALLCALTLGVRAKMLHTYVELVPAGPITVAEVTGYVENGDHRPTPPGDPKANTAWLEAAFDSTMGGPSRFKAVRLTLTENGAAQEIVVFTFAADLWQKLISSPRSITSRATVTVISGSRDLARAYYCPWPDYDAIEAVAAGSAELTPAELPAGARLVWER